MKVYLWEDRLIGAGPRAMLHRGECDRGQCGQFALSISNGELGLTVRFESAAEFHQFMDRGEMATQSSEGCRDIGTAPAA